MESLYIYRSKNKGYSPIDSLSFYILNALNFAIEKKSYSDVKILYECLEIYQDNLRKYPDEPKYRQQWGELLQSVGLGELADKPILDNISVIEQQENNPENNNDNNSSSGDIFEPGRNREGGGTR